MHERYALAFLWLLLFSRIGIFVQAALGDLGMWTYVAACFAYAYGWHLTLPRKLRLWLAPSFRPSI